MNDTNLKKRYNFRHNTYSAGHSGMAGHPAVLPSHPMMHKQASSQLTGADGVVVEAGGPTVVVVVSAAVVVVGATVVVVGGTTVVVVGGGVGKAAQPQHPPKLGK